MPPTNPLRLPPLSTDHLIIRDFASDDFETVHRILDLEGAFGDGDAREDRQNWFDWSLRNYAAFASLYQPPWGERAVTLKKTGEVIGVVGYATMFHPLTEMLEGKSPAQARWHPEMGLFWVITPDHQGKGYAAEAAEALIDYAFEFFNLKRIVANTDFDNLASQAVMKKLGMTLSRNPGKEPEWFEVLGVLERE